MLWPVENLESINACPVCESTLRDLLYKGMTDRLFNCVPGEWVLYQCRCCRSAYLNPRPSLKTIGLAYKNYFTHELYPNTQDSNTSFISYIKKCIKNAYLEERFGVTLYPKFPFGLYFMYLFPNSKLRFDRSVRHLSRSSNGAKVLDIGCGNGEFVRFASSLGWDAQGMDPDPNAVAVARKAGLTVTEGGFPNINMPDMQFDVVTLSNVIEHVHDPVHALREVYRILKPSGRIWISTPNIDSAGHHIFRSNWRGIEPPRHLVIFNASSLILACKRVGFKKIDFLRQPPGSTWYFKMSLRIFRDVELTEFREEALSLSMKFLAKIADLRAAFIPKKAEEIVMVATKI